MPDAMLATALDCIREEPTEHLSHAMIPAPPVSVACPRCGTLHADPRHMVYSVFGTHIYSDLDRVVLSTAVAKPKYVCCHECGRVGLRADFLVAQTSPDRVRPARWVEATYQQAAAALDLAQAPFLAGSREAHDLRLWLWRKENHRIRTGLRVTDPQRREEMLEILLAESRALGVAPLYKWCSEGVERQPGSVDVPVYMFLQAEIHRQRREFEIASQIFKNLCDLKDDASLAWYSLQQMEWCAEGRAGQELLKSPPKPADPGIALMPRSIKYKFVVAAVAREMRDKVSAWVKFPDGAMTIEDLKSLATGASMVEPLAGIVVCEQDVTSTWPGETGPAAFVDSIVKINRSVCWLVVGELPRARALVTILRVAGFHASSIDWRHLDHARFESWALHGKRKADRQWRRVRKSFA